MNVHYSWFLRISSVLILLASFTAQISAQATERHYNASGSPASVAAGSNNAHSITILNCNGSVACNNLATTNMQAIKAATIAVPAGFTVTSAFGLSASAGKTWNAALVAGTIQLTPTGGSQSLDAGQSVTVTFNADAPCEAGFHTWTTAAYNGTDFTTPYTRQGLNPQTEVTGSCESTDFEPGDYCTYTQGGWGAPPNGGNPGAILSDNWAGVYGGSLVVGVGNMMSFDGASDVEAYLPAGGPPGALTGNVSNPTSTSAGVFGGQVTSLVLNVDFNDAGVIDGFLGSISGLHLVTGDSLDGLTVAAVMSAAEQALGGGALPAGYTIDSLNALVDNLNKAFDNCIPGDWAQTHLSP